MLIGVPPSGRFQVVSFDEQVYNKERGSKASIFGKNSEAENSIRYAFTKGPTIKGDYFHTLKYTAVPGVDDINETASYNVLFSVLKIQERLKNFLATALLETWTVLFLIKTMVICQLIGLMENFFQ